MQARARDTHPHPVLLLSLRSVTYVSVALLFRRDERLRCFVPMVLAILTRWGILGLKGRGGSENLKGCLGKRN